MQRKDKNTNIQKYKNNTRDTKNTTKHTPESQTHETNYYNNIQSIQKIQEPNTKQQHNKNKIKQQNKHLKNTGNTKS